MSTSMTNNPGKSAIGLFVFFGLVIIGAGIGVSFPTQRKTTQPTLPAITNTQFTQIRLKSASSIEAKPEASAPDSLKPIPPLDVPGLRNVFRLGDNLFSGSSPTEEESFAALAQLGIKTIIGVDALAPDSDSACATGLCYIHLPLNYAGITHGDLVKLVQATRALPGPFYIHCHHGKNRGPAAAVAIWRCQDQSLSGEQAVAALKMIGTAERYQGLIASVQNAVRPTESELASANLTEVANVEELAKSMAVVDRMWDKVAEPAKDRDSITISNQLDTAYDIADQFRESACLAEESELMRTGFEAVVDDIERLAVLIKCELRNPTVPVLERQAVVAAITTRCTECHARFRDGDSGSSKQIASRPQAVR